MRSFLLIFACYYTCQANRRQERADHNQNEKHDALHACFSYIPKLFSFVALEKKKKKEEEENEEEKGLCGNLFQSWRKQMDVVRDRDKKVENCLERMPGAMNPSLLVVHGMVDMIQLLTALE
ncbi:hypothetical protein CEXT_465811 [Caerostris extrusa]|uniref:Uncharacterized protein n=1 Tax=Caerostris extrusa TaxID=172846 RepID=A0AAV4PV62_CAEEX|nr:hypothetical protein CEXT_465811 [Caerostris extrusa]